MNRHRVSAAVLLAASLLPATTAPTAERAPDPLPSWSDGPAKRSILDFVDRVTREGGPDYVSPTERVAVFDNDGTLWVEKPVYIQLAFALDRVEALAPEHPEWVDRQPFAAILSGNREAVSSLTERDGAALLAATHAGMTTDEFDRIARDWLDTARHPRFGRLFKECVYLPQLELLSFLRANGFKTFIVSGGGIDFLRAFAEKTYGIPPEQVVGSSGRIRFELRDGEAVLVKLPEIGSIDDKEGKPINIHLHIGRRPILAFGNSDGDLAMLRYTDAGPHRRLLLLVHHDDARREYAYDRDSKIGRLDEAIEEAERRKWTVVSMKDDWGMIFPEPKTGTETD